MSGKIFINYRRGDDPGNTGRLFDHLEDVFPRDRLFMDVDSIQPGHDFVRVLDEQVAQCDVLLAVIGNDWLDARDGQGVRRLDKPDDFVRIEIASALRQGKLVIPVLVDNARMPQADELPDAIRPLARRNAVRLTHERFKSDTEGLIKAIKQALNDAAALRRPPEATARTARAPTKQRKWLRGLGVALGSVILLVLVGPPLLTSLLIALAPMLITDHSIRTFRGHSKDVTTVAFSPDGRTALSGSLDSTVKLWDVATGKELHTLKGHVPSIVDGRIDSVAFSPDGRTALSGRRHLRARQSERLKLWELATGKELQTFQTYEGPAVFSPNGRTVLSNGSDDQWRFGLDPKLRLWDVATGKELHTLGNSAAFAVAFLSDGRTALSLDYEGRFTLWDVVTGRQLRTYRGTWDSYITAVAFSPDGRTALIGGGWDKKLKLWELASGKELQTFTEYRYGVSSVVFSPDGRTALSAGNFDHMVKRWDIATGKELRTFTGNLASVYAVAVSPDGRTALSGSSDGTLKLWDLTGPSPAN